MGRAEGEGYGGGDAPAGAFGLGEYCGQHRATRPCDGPHFFEPRPEEVAHRPDVDATPAALRD